MALAASDRGPPPSREGIQDELDAWIDDVVGIADDARYTFRLERRLAHRSLRLAAISAAAAVSFAIVTVAAVAGMVVLLLNSMLDSTIVASAIVVVLLTVGLWASVLIAGRYARDLLFPRTRELFAGFCAQDQDQSTDRNQCR